MEYSDDNRKQIFNRTEGHCGNCGKKLVYHNYEIVHPDGAWVIDLVDTSSQGRIEDIQNAFPICIVCNRKKQYLLADTMRVPDELKGLEKYCTRAKVIDIEPELVRGKLVYEQDITLELPNGKTITYWERTENFFEEIERGEYFHFMFSMVGVGNIDKIGPNIYLLDRRYVAGRIEEIIKHGMYKDQIILDTHDAFVLFETREALKINDFIRVEGALVADFKLDRPFWKPGTIVGDEHGNWYIK